MALCPPGDSARQTPGPAGNLGLGLRASRTVRNSVVGSAQTPASVSGCRADYDRVQARSKPRAGTWGAKLPPGFCLPSQLPLKLTSEPRLQQRMGNMLERGTAVCSRCAAVSGPRRRRWALSERFTLEQRPLCQNLGKTAPFLRLILRYGALRRTKSQAWVPTGRRRRVGPGTPGGTPGLQWPPRTLGWVRAASCADEKKGSAAGPWATVPRTAVSKAAMAVWIKTKLPF